MPYAPRVHMLMPEDTDYTACLRSPDIVLTTRDKEAVTCYLCLRAMSHRK